MKKICPFCAEKIQADAKICRYCGKDIPFDIAKSDNDSKTMDETLKPKKKKPIVGYLAILIMIFSIVNILPMWTGKISTQALGSLFLLIFDIFLKTMGTGVMISAFISGKEYRPLALISLLLLMVSCLGSNLIWKFF